MKNTCLSICLCLSIQGCSMFGGPTSVPEAVVNAVTGKEEKPSGLQTITQVLMVMASLKLLTM